ncbi:MAG: hypothetical protein JSW41_04800 [Candidatus Aenigmatarchaeota archaeon]|nr:MAG: hypothetical protein JSW41_04800 [Candidatus Aenigmarchaeota archaeon]
MRTLNDLIGKHVEYISKREVRGGYRGGKVFRVDGNNLTIRDVLKRKERIHKDQIRQVWWHGKLRPIDEWLNNGGE